MIPKGLTRAKAAIKVLGDGYATAVKALTDDAALEQSPAFAKTPPVDTVSMLSSLAAVPRQFATTYAIRCHDGTASFADLNAVDADLVGRLVAAGTFDVALVSLTDAVPIREFSGNELQRVRDAIVRRCPDIGKAIRAQTLQDGLTYHRVNLHAGRAAASLHEKRSRKRQPQYVLMYNAADVDLTFNYKNLAIDAGDVDATERDERKHFGVYARDNSYVDLNLQPLADFITNFGTTFKPILPPPRTIVDVAMHPQTPLPNDLPTSLLVGRTVGKWVATSSLDNLSSPVLLFWPKKHRVRLLGFAAAFTLLQDAFHAPHNELPLGYTTLSDLATAVMEMLGDTDVMTTDANRKTMTAFVSESRSSLLRSLYVTHCIDIFDDTKRCDGVEWLKRTCVEFGWEDVGGAIVQLVDQSLGDWHKTHAYAHLDWTNLASTLRFVMALLNALTELKQPYFSELVATLWTTVVSNVLCFRDVDANDVKPSDEQRRLALRAMLLLEARVACDAAPTSFHSRLLSTLVRSSVTPAVSVISIVQRFPVAMAPLLELLPGILAMDGTLPIPLLPLVQDALKAQYAAVARSDDRWGREDRLDNLHRWMGLERNLVATVTASWRLCSDTTVLSLLRALHQGLHVAAADATAIANLVMGFSESLADKKYLDCDSDDDDDEWPTTALHAALLVLDRLSPSIVPLFVAGLLNKVAQANQFRRQQYTRSVLYPMIRLLDDKLPAKYAASRQALVAAALPELESVGDLGCDCEYCFDGWGDGCTDESMVQAREQAEARIAYLRDTTQKRAAATSTPSTKRAKNHAGQR